MPLSEQTDDIARLIDNQRKSDRNVTPEHTHVECPPLCDGGILAVKDDGASACLTSETHLRFNDYWRHYPSHTTEAL